MGWRCSSAVALVADALGGVQRDLQQPRDFFFYVGKVDLNKSRISAKIPPRSLLAESTIMARNHRKPGSTLQRTLEPAWNYCFECGHSMWVTYHGHRRLLTLQGVLDLTLPIRQCRNPECCARKHSVRPWEEGALALPQGGMRSEPRRVVGALCFPGPRSLPENHSPP